MKHTEGASVCHPEPIRRGAPQGRLREGTEKPEARRSRAGALSIAEGEGSTRRDLFKRIVARPRTKH